MAEDDFNPNFDDHESLQERRQRILAELRAKQETDPSQPYYSHNENVEPETEESESEYDLLAELPKRTKIKERVADPREAQLVDLLQQAQNATDEKEQERLFSEYFQLASEMSPSKNKGIVSGKNAINQPEFTNPDEIRKKKLERFSNQNPDRDLTHDLLPGESREDFFARILDPQEYDPRDPRTFEQKLDDFRKAKQRANPIKRTPFDNTNPEEAAKSAQKQFDELFGNVEGDKNRDEDQ